MSLENIGIGGLLTFNGAEAVTGMNAVTIAANNLNRSQGNLSSGSASLSTSIGMLGGQIEGLGLAFMPFTEAVIAAEEKAAKFQDTMLGLQATADVTNGAMGAFAKQSKELAASGSAFGASEIALGMGELSRAGASQAQVMAGIKPVMDEATVAQIDLGKAAKLTAGVIRSFNLDFNDTAHVADVLTLVAGHTVGGIEALGGSLRAAGTTSNMLGINLSTTSALMSVMASAGIQGTSAGTAFTTMMQKLLSPSKTAAGWIAANHVEMKKFADGSLDVVGVLSQITDKIDGYSDVTKRAAATQALFGLRGTKAFNAVREAIVTGRLPDLMNEIGASAAGAASRMSEARMDGFTQQLKAAGNAMEVFMIEAAGPLLGPLTDTVKMFSGIIGNVTKALIDLEDPTTTNSILVLKYGKTVAAVAEGINDGINTILGVWAQVKPAIMSTISAITGDADPDMVRTLSKWAVMLFAVAAAVAPIMVAVGGFIAFVTTVAAPAVAELGDVALVASGITVVAMGIAGAAFVGMADKGESAGHVTARAFNIAQDAANTLKEDGIKPLAATLAETTNVSYDLQYATDDATKNMKHDYQDVFGYVVRQSPVMKDGFIINVGLMQNAIMVFKTAVKVAMDDIMVALNPVNDAFHQMAIWMLEHVAKGMRGLAIAAQTIGHALHLDSNSAGWQAVDRIASQSDEDLDASNSLKNVSAAINAGSKSPKAAEAPPDLAADENEQARGIDALNGVTAEQMIKNAQWKARHADPKVEVHVGIDDKRKLDISNCMTVDGRSMKVATGKYTQEINERNGFRATPWQRRQILETGATPTNNGGAH